MLESLYVKNLALIDKTEVRFTPGLNILSGETGAGKSIIIGSVLIALGSKVPKDMIRKGESEAYVELVFSLPDKKVQKALEKLDIFCEEDQLILSRRITQTHSLCRINGESVTVSRLREAAALLIDVHGQNEHTTLLLPNRQLELVDRFGKEKIYPVLEEMEGCYRKYSSLKDELKKCSVDEAMRLRTQDILSYEINEIEEASIHVGEEEKLEKEWKRLSSMERVRASLEEITALLSDEEGGAGGLLDRAVRAAQNLENCDSSYAQIYRQLMDAESIIGDCFHDADRMLSEAQDDPGRLDEVAERMDTIRHLCQKYSCDEKGLLFLLEKKKAELDACLHMEENRIRIEKEMKEAFSLAKTCAEKLTGLRKESACILAEKLRTALSDLNFLDVRFEVRTEKKEEIRANGQDDVSFYIALNPGEDLKPLNTVASGGELSRIMLAIKSVLAKQEETGTLIFDEIDTGISGRTAQKVAARLALTAASAQVICISHLPQIVSMADTHFLIRKETDQARTFTRIFRLEEEESVLELARLLGGSEITEAVTENAREMKALAKKKKASEKAGG